MLIIRRDTNLINPYRIQSITKILNISGHKLVKKKREKNKNPKKINRKGTSTRQRGQNLMGVKPPKLKFLLSNLNSSIVVSRVVSSGTG